MNSKKVLIITYYWPPAGGPGVQRWLKFVKYLPEFGIEPIVYCPEGPNYPIVDNSLISEVSKNLKVVRKPISEPYRFAQLFSKKSTKKISSGIITKEKKQSIIEKLMLYVRGNFFIPDARKNWVKPSVDFLYDYILDNDIKTIITTGPPHSLHLIGQLLKQKTKVKWVADFRDPWTTIGYHKKLKLTRSSKEKHRQLEHSVLNSADQIIVTSGHTKTEFEAKTNVPIKQITNGYDYHDVKIEKKDDQFTISHIGSLLSDRNPVILWEVLAELIEENDEFKRHFRLNFIGIVSDDVLESIYNYNLKENSNVLGYVDHKDAIKYQMRSQLLLLVEIDSEDTKAIIPGKLFEYLISETPILAIGPKSSDVEQIIKETNTGHYFYYNDKNKLKTQILDYFELYKTNVLTTNAIGFERYSRKTLTKELIELL